MGPRALGNRSILADPRDVAIKDQLNARIKQREPFRPFAPAVLVERASEFFEIDQPDPFMTMAPRVRADKVAADPGGRPRRRHGDASRPSIAPPTRATIV